MTQRAKIEPFVRRTLHRSVVGIESVDINVDFGHCIQSLTDSIRTYIFDKPKGGTKLWEP